jgi:DNA-directed RNA polymerase specialized sigma24 family protein
VRRVSKTALAGVGKDVIAAAGLVPVGNAVPEPTFEEVVSSDTRRLFTLALSILRDEGEAEDAVQETLLKAWRRWTRDRHGNRRSGWRIVALSRSQLHRWVRRRCDPASGAAVLVDQSSAVDDLEDPHL